jgi:hydroxypyruvate reductase
LRSGAAAVDPAGLVREAFERLDPLPSLSDARLVVAAGKAARPMFAAVEELVPIAAAVIAVPHGGPAARGARVNANGGRGDRLIFAAGHPAPNEASVAAGESALALAERSASGGGLLVLLSGGASALLVAPVAGVSLGDKTETSRRLMEAGAPIHELNCVRKHLSRIKGGQLAAAARRTVTLALSDVHGPVADDPSVIGSGPTVPDETTFEDALAIVRARNVDLPDSVRAHLERGARREASETPKPGDPRIAESIYQVIGNRQTAVAGAVRVARSRGYRAVTLDAATTGEAREAGRAFVEEARRIAGDVLGPLCVIGSGETTVTVRGGGRGGRNQEFALAAAALLRSPAGEAPQASGRGPAVLGSAGTDGIDGPTDAAGAIVDSTTVDRAERLGLDPGAALAGNDSYRFFERLGDLILWGPTDTNVGDLHVLIFG